MLEETNPYAALDRSGARIRDAVLGAAKAKGLPVQVPQFGSMFSIFFNSSPVTDLSSAMASDAKLYARFFHAALKRGVYLAPSAYEAAFLSTAHDAATVDRACEIFSAGLAEL
jgi:glutamate-1-semialdehyde 2,1-aminomutase